MKVGRAGAPQSPLPLSAARSHGAGRGRSFLEVLQEGGPRKPEGPKPPPPRTTKPLPVAPSSPLARGVARVLENAATGEARLDKILDAAARGKTFTPAELLAMQATVFRYSQTIEVISRATDRLVGAVKQTLGTQV
jgi:hypothetical protein